MNRFLTPVTTGRYVAASSMRSHCRPTRKIRAVNFRRPLREIPQHKGFAAISLAAGALVIGTGTSFANPGSHDHGQNQALFVSNASGVSNVGAGVTPASVSNSGFSSQSVAHGCANAPYTTIGAAVTAASAGEMIIVCPGVYAEDVVVPAAKPLTIEGIGNPLINAVNLNNGVQVLASNSTVEGFTIGYANGEGILVGGQPGTSGTVNNVTVTGNTVLDNDRGNPLGASVSTSSYAECNASQAGPGDCGEGIHLLSADNSTVTNNKVTGNSGGILLTDENGPTDGNLIGSNKVTANAYDCGITIAGHHLGTTTNGIAWTTVLPSVGGVYNNTISNNHSNNNGVLGQGGGVLLATGVPGGAVYNNVVVGNTISGNGLAGVTVHSHSPGENLNGNVIKGNTIGTNNIDGDPDFAPAIDALTTAVIVAPAVSPITIKITNNQINNDSYGIWLTPGVTANTNPANSFTGVATPIFTAP